MGPGQPGGEDPNLSATLTEIGQDPDRVLERAQTETTGRALAAANDEAMALGVFGSPTFVVGREVSWGDDRLDDAVLWAKDD